MPSKNHNKKTIQIQIDERGNDDSDDVQEMSPAFKNQVTEQVQIGQKVVKEKILNKT